MQPHTHHTQSIRPLYKGQTKERQDWQDWGKEQGGESTGTESTDETATGWETSHQHEDDQWGRGRGGEVWGQNQNATGGEWGWGAEEGRNQNAASGWGQNTGEGRGHTGGGWDQGTAEGRGGQGINETWSQNVGGWAQELTNPKNDEIGRAHV